MTTGFWCIGRGEWQSVQALDEFGDGTLDGNPADGPSFDGCAAAAQENGRCAIEGRPLTYAGIGKTRAAMIEHGDWTQPATVSNPRTGGAEPAHIRNQLVRDGYTIDLFLDEQPATLTPQQIREAIHYQTMIVLMVFQAHNLSGNEQNVFRHFVTIAAYGGDAGPGNSGGADSNGYGMVYVLNSDEYGQHGTAIGQWMWIDQVLAADPRAFVVAHRTPPPPPPPPPPPLDVPGAVKLIEATVAGLQVAVTVLQQALAKLGA